MLIRSQDKTIMVNIDNVFNIAIRDINGATAIYTGSSSGCCIMAEYSTKVKAMKVLDMVQEAYAEYKFTCTFLTGFTGHRAIVESNDICVNGFKELAEDFKKNMVFQMPADSEAEA